MHNYRTIWMKRFSDELGRLAQGIQDIPGTDTIQSIRCSDFLKVLTVTYIRICVNYRPQKKYPNRTRLRVGGDRIHYP